MISTIYCFKSINDEIIYIGSTNDIYQRYRAHKSCCYNENLKEHNYPLYQYMRDNNGIENFKFKKICDIDEEFRRITEQFYIDMFKPKCNTYNVIFDEELRKIYMRKMELKRQDDIVCCRTCRCEIRRDNLKKHFRTQKHIDKLDYQKYIEKKKNNKKEYDKEYRKLKVYCEVCNCDVKRKTLQSHFRTQKHINNL